MLKEFKEFIMGGNIFDMAIGVIIGGAFQKIVTSLVDDIIMPLISLVAGKVDFSSLSVTIGQASITYGKFVTEIINFLIIALSIFIAIRSVNKLSDKAKGKLFKNKVEEAEQEPTVKVCSHCYSEINYKATRCPHCTSELD